MSTKTGRNDPCPCGSGRKYKHCCGGAAAVAQVEEKGHAGAVERALGWLSSRHRVAIEVALEAMLFEGLSEDEQADLKTLDDDTWEQIGTNANEWLLAEGVILAKGESIRVPELLIGPGGPLFTVGQRKWLTQLSQSPLRLYDVTDVVPDRQMTLCDALDPEAAPIVVNERLGTQRLQPGTLLGVRLMEVDDHRELSGSIYAFSLLAAPHVVSAMRQTLQKRTRRGKHSATPSSIMWRHWLKQFVGIAPFPTIVDALTGESLLLITDHYHVKDWSALEKTLTARNDVDGDRESGWNRTVKGKDSQLRPIANINPERNDRVSIFYKTQGYADRGRPWFDDLAGNAVQFISRELTDPKGAFANLPDEPAPRVRRRPPDLPPEVMAEIIETAIRQTYANWCDEPISVLGDKTPRQAIRTPAGLERVKGLLRGYEASEKEQAREQGRPAISYEFLWKAIGIAR